LEEERRAATTKERKDRLLDAITAKQNTLTEMLKAQAAAAGNYTARDLTSFI
jgi:hypothetical protein